MFFKKPEFRDLTEHWWWSRQLPWLPGQCRNSWFNLLNLNLVPGQCDHLEVSCFGFLVSKTLGTLSRTPLSTIYRLDPWRTGCS